MDSALLLRDAALALFLTLPACGAADRAGSSVQGAGGSVGHPAGGTGGHAESDPSIVHAESFEAGFDAGDWQVDATGGARDGSKALHPPPLQAGEQKTVTFTCDGRDHTQLSFFWAQLAGQNAACCPALPTETLGLDLLVDGEHRETFGRSDGWQRVRLNVPPGPHEYTFIARARVDTTAAGSTEPTPPFVLDAFECRYVEPEPARDEVDFDEQFVPLEVGGAWFVDNTRGTQHDEAAIHPPAMKAGDVREMSFDCNGQSHRAFSFWWNQIAGQNAACCDALPSEELAFELAVDGEFRETFGHAGGWKHVTLEVPEGTHVYTFTARTKNDTFSAGTNDPTPPFVLDEFAWTN